MPKPEEEEQSQQSASVGFTYLRSGADREQVEMMTKGSLSSQAAAQAAAQAAPPPTAEEYPADGTIAEVKAWVGDDLDRAEAALDREGERQNPRVTLVDYLQDLLTDSGNG